MLIRPSTLVGFALVVFSGCSTYDPDLALRNVTAALAVPAASIEFQEQGLFAVTAVSSRTIGAQTSGVLALTAQEFTIFSREGSRGSYLPRIRFPYSQLRGVALWRLLNGRQLQVFTESSLIVVTLAAQSMLPDSTPAEQAFSTIRRHGVPEVNDVGFITTPAPFTLFLP